MKCKGKIKVKAENGKTRATNCNEQLELHAIFCPKCGTAFCEHCSTEKNELGYTCPKCKTKVKA